MNQATATDTELITVPSGNQLTKERIWAECQAIADYYYMLADEAGLNWEARASERHRVFHATARRAGAPAACSCAQCRAECPACRNSGWERHKAYGGCGQPETELKHGCTLCDRRPQPEVSLNWLTTISY